MSERVYLAPEAIDAIAHRVVELLRDEGHGAPSPRLVDATQLAGLLGLSRATVYEHADELHAIRVGDGPRGRLRFDVDAALAAWQHREPGVEPEPERITPRRRTTSQGAALLPVHGLPDNPKPKEATNG